MQKIPQGKAAKKKVNGQENDGKETPTSAHGNATPASSSKNLTRDCTEAEGSKTANMASQDPLWDYGIKDNGSDVNDGKVSGKEVKGEAKRDPRGS